MNKLPNIETLKEIAMEMNIEPSFVEKDWYVVQALNAVSGLNTEKFI